MFIHIRPDELVDDFKNSPWKLNHLWNVGIDYASNTIDGVYADKEVCLFEFKDYGVINDNRFNKYMITWSESGIFIEIKIVE